MWHQRTKRIGQDRTHAARHVIHRVITPRFMSHVASAYVGRAEFMLLATSSIEH